MRGESPSLQTEASQAPAKLAAARCDLNSQLRGILLQVQECSEHSDAFKTVVEVAKVTDYHSFVDVDDSALCLDQILSRTSCCWYSSVQQFKRDFERLLANAMAYHSAGHGIHAHRPIIDWAQLLLDNCCKLLEINHNSLRCAEQQFKDASQTVQECPPRKPDDSLDALLAACEQAADQEGFEDVAFLPASDEPPAKRRPAAQRSSASTPADMSAAVKYRRHKSKVFIRLNKVVYLPTTFMEENFDPRCLPFNCKMIVETNGKLQPDLHQVTIKSVPRQGLSTMYCMTNVMKFQQQYLNWQILDWTRVDEEHIKIHLQGAGDNTHAHAECEEVTAAAGRKKRMLKAGGSHSLTAAYDSEDHAGSDEAAGDDGSELAMHALDPSGGLAFGGDWRAAAAPQNTASQGLCDGRQGSGSSSPSHLSNLPHEGPAPAFEDAKSVERECVLSRGNSSGFSNNPPPCQQQLLQPQQQLPLLQQYIGPQQLYHLLHSPRWDGSKLVSCVPTEGLSLPLQMPYWGVQSGDCLDDVAMHMQGPGDAFGMGQASLGGLSKSFSMMPLEPSAQPQHTLQLLRQLVSGTSSAACFGSGPSAAGFGSGASAFAPTSLTGLLQLDADSYTASLPMLKKLEPGPDDFGAASLMRGFLPACFPVFSDPSTATFPLLGAGRRF